MSKEEITEEQLDIMAEAFGTGYEWSQEILNEKRFTNWTLADMDLSTRGLNQLSMDSGLEGIEFAAEHEGYDEVPDDDKDIPRPACAKGQCVKSCEECTADPCPLDEEVVPCEYASRIPTYNSIPF